MLYWASFLKCSVMLKSSLAYFSLAVRDLSSLVKPGDIITSEHLVTLLAVVPKYSQKDWLSRYETLTTYVVSIAFNFYSFSLCVKLLSRGGPTHGWFAAVMDCWCSFQPQFCPKLKNLLGYREQLCTLIKLSQQRNVKSCWCCRKF